MVLNQHYKVQEAPAVRQVYGTCVEPASIGKATEKQQTLAAFMPSIL